MCRTKLGLGTVQLGLPYGIANQTGKPNKQEAFEILARAANAGITCFDTASAYGDSEALIGEFLAEGGFKGRFEISTKIKSVEASDKDDLREQMEREAEQSLKRLGLRTLDYLLLHNSGDLRRYGSDIAAVGQELVENGLIRQFGVSVYSPEDVELCLSYDSISVIQIPFNILDDRLIERSLLPRLREKGVTVHARSAYLQGLILMDSKELPGHLIQAQPYLARLEAECEKRGLSKKQLAFCYVRDNPNIDNFFIGCETLEQLNETIELNKLPELPQEELHELGGLFKDIPENILDPSQWKPVS